MDVQKAQKIVSKAVEGRKRWGRMYASDLTVEELFDALLVLDEALVLAVTNQDNLVEKEDLTKARRQVTAANAREQRQKKKIAKLEKEVWDWSEQCANLREQVTDLQAQLDGYYAASAAEVE